MRDYLDPRGGAVEGLMCSDWVTADEMTLAFVLNEVQQALADGMTFFGTQTDKKTEPWRTRIVAYNKEDR